MLLLNLNICRPPIISVLELKAYATCEVACKSCASTYNLMYMYKVGMVWHTVEIVLLINIENVLGPIL